MNVIRRLMGSVFLCMALITAAAPMDAEAGAIPEMLRRKPDTDSRALSRLAIDAQFASVKLNQGFGQR